MVLPRRAGFPRRIIGQESPSAADPEAGASSVAGGCVRWAGVHAGVRGYRMQVCVGGALVGAGGRGCVGGAWARAGAGAGVHRCARELLERRGADRLAGGLERVRLLLRASRGRARRACLLVISSILFILISLDPKTWAS